MLTVERLGGACSGFWVGQGPFISHLTAGKGDGSPTESCERQQASDISRFSASGRLYSLVNRLYLLIHSKTKQLQGNIQAGKD